MEDVSLGIPTAIVAKIVHLDILVRVVEKVVVTIV